MIEARARRRVLVLSYLFPPVGGGSAHRNAALIRRFPELGYDPVVVTGSGGADHFWAPGVEATPESLSGAGRIVRVPGPEPAASAGLRRRVQRLLDLKGAWSRWWTSGALEAARRELPECDILYASLEPYETARVASVLSRELGKPWVADLLDPWALDEMRMHVSWIHRWADRTRMHRWLASASAVIMNTPEATGRVRREIPELAALLVDPIAVGYDANDFTESIAERTDRAFRIVHSGYLHTELGLRHRKTAMLRRLAGGVYAPVDLLSRSHVYLLTAIDRLIAEDPGLRSVIEVHLAGALSDADRAVAERSPVVKIHEYLPHGEAVELVRTADLLFLPMHEVPRGARAGLVPAKTYEYLASGRPILAAVPEGDARDLLLEAGSPRICRPSDDVAMAEHIRAEIARWRAGAQPVSPRPDVVARYERGVIARELTSVFDRVLARSARGPQTRAAASPLARSRAQGSSNVS